MNLCSERVSHGAKKQGSTPNTVWLPNMTGADIKGTKPLLFQRLFAGEEVLFGLNGFTFQAPLRSSTVMSESETTK
jgi:hypothetical protein